MSTPDKEMVQKPKSNTSMWAAVGIVLIVIILVVVAFEAGWIGKSSPSSTTPPATMACVVPSGQTVSGAGSTFVYPLMFQWQSSYTTSTIDYNSVGSGTGITDLAATSVNFAATDAPLSATQRATLPAAATSIVTMPESAGAVAMIYNVPDVTTLHFNGTVLAEIYLGTITNWNDSALVALNPGVTLPNQPITPVHRTDGSGTSFAFTHFLTLDSPTWASQVGFATSPVWPTGVGTGQSKSGGVATYVQTTPYTIGYVDLEYALGAGISFGEVQNPTGNFVLPSIATAGDALAAFTGTLPTATDASDWFNVSLENMPGNSSYPISTFTYLVSYQDLSAAFTTGFSADQANAMLSFWNWTIHEGQTYSAGLYYVPLPAPIVTADEAELAAFTWDGGAVPHC
jgi:phosphate transport system substrate-binding protein